ncbi:hexosaminidase protein [Dioscorea alata]|uniref:Hexosaminidase protein n=1 Tax=Dioscorea alata TaxID=55571 RepID=A0ACB7VU54_DIOAL|nr:hexosaminidase protein [Dioscorea alata]
MASKSRIFHLGLLLGIVFVLAPLSDAGKAREARRRVSKSSLDLDLNDTLVYLWPLPKNFSQGDQTLTVNPDLTLQLRGARGSSLIVSEAFERYKDLVFRSQVVLRGASFDVSTLTVVVESDDDELQFGVDESYAIYVAGGDSASIIGQAIIEANTIYGALRGLETFSQLCIFNYESKRVEIYKAPWYIKDEPRFAFRGLLLDTSRHFLPISTIKQVIDSMSYAKLNVLHWHIIDEEAFPLEVPSYPDLWKGSYSKWERYTVEDAKDVVNFAKKRGIHVMAEIDVPGHAESWGSGYPDLFPSSNCTEPLDVTKNFTFEVISGILSDMRKIFPFGFFHLGGDEVHTDCWNSTPHIKLWLEERNMTTKAAYQYFVLKAQEIALAHNWIPVNWEETFHSFKEKLSPQTVVHNWYGPRVCPEVVANGFRCIFSNQGVWYLNWVNTPWEDFYTSEPWEGIDDPSQQQLVIGGEVCMWDEFGDTSDLQQTIWPRAAAAAERLWGSRYINDTKSLNTTVLPRLQYFRCLLNHRGIAAAPVTNKEARTAPVGPGSCFAQ